MTAIHSHTQWWWWCPITNIPPSACQSKHRSLGPYRDRFDDPKGSKYIHLGLVWVQEVYHPFARRNVQKKFFFEALRSLSLPGLSNLGGRELCSTADIYSSALTRNDDGLTIKADQSVCTGLNKVNMRFF